MMQRISQQSTRVSGVRFASITPNVHFTHVAREWRCKWSTDNDKAALSAVQNILSKHTSAIKSVPGVKSVQRIVCGGCQDFKVIVKLEKPDFDKFAATNFGPEAKFLEELKATKGVTAVETQTYTLEQV